MMKNFYFTKQENVHWIIFLFFVVLIYYNEMILQLLFYWIIIILFVGNAKRISSKKYYNAFTILRRSMYIIPLLIPMIGNFEISYFILNSDLVLWIVLGILIGSAFVLPKYKEWQIVLSDDLIHITATKNKFFYKMSIYTFVGGAVSEELFFRYFILGIFLMNGWIVEGILTSSILFMVLHYTTKWSEKFSKSDFITQLLFGIFSGILFIISESIIPSLIAHLIVNSPHIIQAAKSHSYVED